MVISEKSKKYILLVTIVLFALYLFTINTGVIIGKAEETQRSVLNFTVIKVSDVDIYTATKNLKSLSNNEKAYIYKYIIFLPEYKFLIDEKELNH